MNEETNGKNFSGPQEQSSESGVNVAGRWDILRRTLAKEQEPFLSEDELKFALERSSGNARAAADFLGVNHQSLINYMKKYGLPIGEPRRSPVTDDWDAIQVAWEDNSSAGEIQKQFGVESGTIRQHARRNGWTPHKSGAKRKNS